MQYNLRSPAVKRILQEARQLQQDPPDEFVAAPLEDDIFEWHFTIRGPSETEFEGGVYHGRILLSPEYPMKPPTIIMLTPSGRFDVNQKICLSVTNYHPEFWRPAWGIRTVCLALISFFPTKGAGAIGALDYTPEERRKYAQKSHSFVCPRCADNELMVLKPLDASAPRRPTDPNAADLEGFDLSFKYEEAATRKQEEAAPAESAGPSASASDNVAVAATASASASAAPLASFSKDGLETASSHPESTVAKLVPTPSPVPSGDLVTPDASTPDLAAPRPAPVPAASEQQRPMPAPSPQQPQLRRRQQQQQRQQQMGDSSGWADGLVVAVIFAVLAFLISRIAN